MASIMRRKVPQPRRRRVTYRPFLPFYRQRDWKAALLGSPQMVVFTTRQEAFDEVDRILSGWREPLGPSTFIRMLRIRASLRR